MLMHEIKKLSQNFDHVARSLPKHIGFHFDLDATLLDNEGPQRDLARDVIIAYMREEFKQPDIAAALEKRNYGHLSGTNEILAAIEGELNMKVSDEGRKEIKRRMADIRETHVPKAEEEMPIIPIAALVYSLRKHDVPCGIVTSSGAAKAFLALEVSGVELFPSGQKEEWFFTSNKGPKTPAHHVARQTLSKIHGRELTHVIAFEDGIDATYQAGLAGAIVIPHVLCSHVSPEHHAARIRALQTKKLQAIHETGSCEKFMTPDGVVREIKEINHIPVVISQDQLLTVLEGTLRPLGWSGAPSTTRPRQHPAAHAFAGVRASTGVR